VANIQQINEAWRSREQRTKSLVFDWQEAELITKGSRCFTTVEGNPIVYKPVFYPPHDVTYEYKRRLKVDRQKMRYESRGPMEVQELGVYLPRWYLSLSDGNVAKTFFDKDESGDERSHASGFIRDPPKQIDAEFLQLRAILVSYRPFTMNLGEDYDLSKYLMRGTGVTIHERDCVVLTGTSKGMWQNRLWIDSEREFVPVRWQSIVQGVLRIQLDVEYEHDASYGWVPCAWKWSCYGHPDAGQPVGKLTEQGSAHVTRHELNVHIPGSEFVFDFPVGTYVGDERNNEHYILRKGGEKRIVTEGEMAVGYTYQRLAATESGKAGGVAGRGLKWGWAFSVIGVLVVTLLVLVLRRRGRTPQGA
jgi:hypothetical protein